VCVRARVCVFGLDHCDRRIGIRIPDPRRLAAGTSASPEGDATFPGGQMTEIQKAARRRVRGEGQLTMGGTLPG